MTRKRRVRATQRVGFIVWVLPRTYDKLEELVAAVKRAHPQWAKRLDLEKEDIAGRFLDRVAPVVAAALLEKLAQTPARRRRPGRARNVTNTRRHRDRRAPSGS
jgi:adenylate kinase family enzyme